MQLPFFSFFLRKSDCNALSKTTGRQSKTKVSFCSLTAYGTAKIQLTVYPFSLSFPFTFSFSTSSFRCVSSGPTTSRQLLSQRIFTCSFFSESLVSFEDCSRAISFFLSFLNNCTRYISKNI